MCVPLCDLCCLFGPGVTGGNPGKSRAARTPSHGRSGVRAGRQEHAVASEMHSHPFSLGHKLEEWSEPRGDRVSDRAYRSGPDWVLQTALVKCRRSSVTRSDAGMRWQVAEGLGKTHCVSFWDAAKEKCLSCSAVNPNHQSKPSGGVQAAGPPVVCGTCLSLCCDLLPWLTPPTLYFPCPLCPSPHCTLRKLILCWNLFSKL